MPYPLGHEGGGVKKMGKLNFWIKSNFFRTFLLRNCFQTANWNHFWYLLKTGIHNLSISFYKNLFFKINSCLHLRKNTVLSSRNLLQIIGDQMNIFWDLQTLLTTTQYHYVLFYKKKYIKDSTVHSRFKKARFKKESRFKKDCSYNRFFST